MSTETAPGEGERPSDGSRAGGVFAAYSPEEPMPLGGYAALMGAYAVGLGGFLALASDRLPKRLAPGDLTLLAIATHKLARIITKDWVTSPMRAPFVTYEKSIGGGEVEEHSRGSGLGRAVGDLLTCPWCIGPWVAGGLFAGYVFQPRITRTVAAIFTLVTVSDVLHHLYAAEKKLAR